MKYFVLLPYEHVGADFNPQVHAETRLEIGGRPRNFLLKMRDGVIYFREPSRGQAYAIPELFDEKLATDRIGLISAWQRAIAAGNYGAFVARREYFEKLPVRGQFLMILKSDGSGWMREWFDDEWFLLPESEKASSTNVWDEKALESFVDERLRAVKVKLLSRAINPTVRENNLPRWIGGSGEQFAALTIAAVRLFGAYSPDYEQSVGVKMKSHSAFAKGEGTGFWLAWLGQRRTIVAPLWELLAREFTFVGVRWSEGGEQVEQQYKRTRIEAIYKAGLERFGENWRGNWAPQRADFTIQIPDLTQTTTHEKLESQLLLREWLRGKMPDEQIETLLQAANV